MKYVNLVINKRILPLLLCCTLLSGCSGAGRSFVRVTPHNERQVVNTAGAAPVENYAGIAAQLQSMVESSVESGTIYAVKMEQSALEQNLAIAVRSLIGNNALGAYAVDQISFEVGTTGGRLAAAVNITYRHSGIELKKILRLSGMEQVEKAVTEALEDCRPGVVMLVEHYYTMDISQLVQDIARRNPQTVMEIPEVAEAVYGREQERIVELSFAYQNSRDSLRQMQSQVRPVFDSAALYVSGEGSDRQKFSQLYAFLMERFDYTIETSITPAYSLLHHGVGDSRAFATVYAAMCSRAGLECLVVTGARNGEPWTWNIICDNGTYAHVDLLYSNNLGYFRKMWDSEMTGYVWDYSAYPRCVYILPESHAEEPSPEETEPDESIENEA